ncbi:MAG: spore maturation protein [Eubacteriales bacterium]|nr:spore maturation protein [Eubacteriales bacterium]
MSLITSCFYTLSNYMIPLVLGYIVFYGFCKKIPIYETFLTGVKEGFQMVIELAPTLIGLLVAVGILRSSGCLALLCNIFTPLNDAFGIHPEIIPVSIVRLFSSSAATGMTLDIFDTYGPDSVIGRTISIMMSSTETVFYTMSVYYLSIGVTKTKWTLIGALICSIAGTIISIWLGMLLPV